KSAARIDPEAFSSLNLISEITIPLWKSCNSSRKGIRDDSTTSTNDRGYATTGIFCKNAGSLRGCSPPSVGTLPLQPCSIDRRTTASIFPVSGQREKGVATDGDHRPVWYQVFLRADASPRL